MSEAFDPMVTPWLVDDVDFPNNAPTDVVLKFLLRYAVLAPSTHNTQPWKFGVADDAVLVHKDESRWLLAADPDQRELLISIGCAIENLLVAAEHFGYFGQVEYMPEPTAASLVARVRIRKGGERSASRAGDLFEAIPRRQTGHNRCEPRPVPQEAVERIKACCDDPAVVLVLHDNPDTIRNADALVIGADAALFADPYYRDELAHWIGQGVFGSSWLMAKLGQFAVSYLHAGSSATMRHDSEAMLSSPIFGLLASQRDDPETWLRAGQIFERIFLTATALGLAMQPMTQLIEVPEVRAQLVPMIGAGMLAQQPFRLGYAEPHPHHTPRRPLEEVMAEPQLATGRMEAAQS
ncbi:MAG TPA: nitroreductase [Candidatus Kapabacteria bacterium]|nr:nitroreductase [Candidatus Kapabacteria bacterium]